MTNPESSAQLTTPLGLSYTSLSIPEEALHSVRMSIFHSTGPGFYVFRGFLPENFVQHISRLWCDMAPSNRPPRPNTKKNSIPEGYPNFFHGTEALRSWCNFFWNSPIDEVTYDVALQAVRLRNRVELRKPYTEILPFTGRAVSFRVTITTSGGGVAPHKDWIGSDYDPSRTQATLLLSTKNTDYSDGGFAFESNQGEVVSIGDHACAGDLVLWRYNNLHWVDPVASSDTQIGFVRMLFPPEEVRSGASPASFIPDQVLTSIQERVAGSRAGQKYLRPVYRAFKRL